MAAIDAISAIELGDLEFGKQQVGIGGSGAVYKGRWKSRRRTVAIKTMNQGVPEKELQVMSLVSHPNIVHFFGAVLQPPTYCIVTEFVEQGSLYDFIHHNGLDPERNLKWAKGIASGMKYLHYDVPNGVVIHGDLKSKNVLITADFSVKICDFGSSKIREQFAGQTVNTTTNILGTIRWMAPEVLAKKPIGRRCDVYSYGIVVWELLTHKIPYEQMLNDFQIYNHVVVDNKHRPEFTDIVSAVEKLTTMFIHQGTKKPPLPSKPKMSPHPNPRNVPAVRIVEETDLPPVPPARSRSLLKPKDKAKSLPRATGVNVQPTATKPKPIPQARPRSGTGPPTSPKPGSPIGPKPGSPIGPKPGAPIGPKPGTPIGPKPGAPIGPKPGPPIGPKPAPNRSPSPYRPECPSKLTEEYESMAEVLTEMKEAQSQQGVHPAWSVSADEIEMLDEEVGRGAWGIVKKARFRGMTVAAKCLHEALREEMTDHLLQAFRREMNIAANLRHPNLVLFLGATVEGNLIILNELMDSSLHAVLEKEQQLSHSQIVIVASDVARALNYLHSWKPEPLLHRDVSSANVLLESVGPSSWKAKLSDYGSLQAINIATTLAPGNPTYAAPEALHPGPQSCKMDVYSFGILLAEMCTNQLPNREDLVSLVQVIKWQAMLNLIELCIQDDPDARPTMKDVIKTLEHLPQLSDKEIDNPRNIYSEMRWFNPSMTRREAIEKLITDASDGNFVVRGGGGSTYSLSLYCSSKVYHYRIWENESSEYYMEEKYQFQTLEELIDYYKQHKGGLLTTLREYSRGKVVEPEVDDNAPVYQVPIVIPDGVQKISRSELTLSSEVVGRGQYGHVVAGSWEGTSCAIRVAKEEHISAALQCFIVDAVNTMKIFYHQSLVKLYGICTEAGPVLVVTEHLVNGPLDKYLKQHPELVQRMDILLYMATQICSAMKWLEAKGMAHEDLATRNCLVGDHNIVKVADYSLSLYTRPRKPSRTVVTIRWAAPECITQSPKFTTKSDVWSFGIVLWELWSGGQMPYSELRNQDVKSQVLSGYRLKKPRTCPHEVHEIMQNCWKMKGEERPRFDQLLQKLTAAFNPDNYATVGDAESTDIAAQLQKLSGERLEIPKSALILGTHHAEGSCGYVAAGTWRGLDVAIRVVDSKALREHKESDFLCEAIAILKNCHNENLIKLHGVSTQEGPTFIVTELLPKGSLYNFLQQHSKQLNKEVLLDMATQICSAMRYLEGKGVIHKDVATRNCLVGERNIVKLADVSLALFTSKLPSVTNVVPVRWAAPEVLQGGHTQFSIKSDIWSFGVFLWELWTGAQTPYSNFGNQQVKDKVAEGYKLDKPRHCPQAVYKLMRHCWKMDINSRPSFASLFTDLRALAPDYGLWAHMSQK